MSQVAASSQEQAYGVLRQVNLSLDHVATTSGPGLVDAATWNQIPNVWANSSRDRATYAAGGWQLQSFNGMAPEAIVVYRRATFLVAGCVAFLLTMAVAWLVRYRSLKLALAGVIISAVVVLVLPAPFSWIGLGAFWGSLASLSLTTFPISSKPDESRSTVTVISTTSLTALFLSVLVVTWPISTFAQDPEHLNNGLPDRITLHRVFVPTDEDGDPDGEFVFVPTALHQILARHAERVEGSASDWVFTSATYRGTLMRQEGTAAPRIDSILAEYQIHVSSLSTPVRLPIPRTSAVLLEREARLNGRPIRLEWNANQSALLLPIRDPGDYELELTYRLRNQGLQTSIDLSIPPVPQSLLLLTSQEDVNPVIVRAEGAVRKDETSSELRAELGPTDRLRLRWGNPESDETGSTRATLLAEDTTRQGIPERSIDRRSEQVAATVTKSESR